MLEDAKTKPTVGKLEGANITIVAKMLRSKLTSGNAPSGNNADSEMYVKGENAVGR
jgi:hypothetical protein